MQKVLIIPAPVLSHLSASFKVASLLKQHQYQIHYFAFHAVGPLIAKNNFAYSPANLPPIMEGYRAALLKLENVRLGYRAFLRKGGLKPFFDERRQELLAVVEKIKPQIIIADTFTAADFAFLYPLLKQYQIRFFQLETLPCTLSIKGVPAFYSFTLPHQKRKIWKEYQMRKWTKAISRFGGRLIYKGSNAYALLKKELKLNKVPQQYQIEKSNYFSLSFTGLPTLLLSPLELEFFAAPPTTNHHFLGFLGNGKAGNGALPDTRLQKLLQPGKTIIYISFGTVFSGVWGNAIADFLAKVDAALAGLKDVIAIFSMGNPQADTVTMPNFAHIHTFAFVPQTYVLQYCSAFITHGGINSIKECVQAAVPMLVVPLDVDQPGNAAKVVHKQLGLAGHVLLETVEGLRAKLELLLQDKRYKQNLEQLKATIATNYDAENTLLTLIEQCGKVE